MAFLNNLFGKKKKRTATCDVSKEPIENGYGYILSTGQVISSKKFWDNVMTEPETMSYTISHFTKKDSMATKIRSMLFEKYSTVEKPWLVSDSFIHLFDIDKSQARQYADKWWEMEGNFVPLELLPVGEELPQATFEKIKIYAIQEAGRQRVAV